MEVHRRLVTVAGAARNYGVVVQPSDFSVDEAATTELRNKMREERKTTTWTSDMSIDRGGTISQLLERCEAETGLKPPRPQWERDPYGPHVGLPYVKEWYKKMREEGMSLFDKA